MHMQRTPRFESARAKKAANISIIGLSAVLALGIGYAVVGQEHVDAEAADAYIPAVAPSVQSAPTEFAPTGQALEQLRDSEEQWTLAVLGDSTGDESDEWVHILTKRLAEETGRPAVIHDWSIDDERYDDTTEIRGKGEPIVVWNGSAHGQTAVYSLRHRSDMVPERPDMVIISHGHNHQDSAAAVDEIGNLARWARTTWQEPPALAVTFQNPRLDNFENRQNATVGNLRKAWANKQNAATIDVFAAYRDTGDPAGLLDSDRLHPNDDGEQLWADTAWEALSLDEYTP